MTNGTDNNNIINCRIPRIRRTRDYHLYDFNSRRYLDLYLDGGLALLGHKYGRAVLMMKNGLEKGLAASYPGVWEARLLKQIKLLYPEIADVVTLFAGSGWGYPVFRPFEYESPAADIQFMNTPFELQLPLPGAGTVKVLCALNACKTRLPAADPVPQYLYSGLCRAAADLKAFIAEADTSLWSAFDSPLWLRRGPWLYPHASGEDYSALFEAFLSRGILISPDPSRPSCAPYRFTKGEIKPIKEIERGFKALSGGASN
ncbi:MAG: hypothetical protein PQJ61_06180 [Spirochaetales bacterium]|uniref:Uncharacterized protein n=1 Tax=Candidatus Thalassospirochaeta sargassi TaxID=3119039 RepID=A0AAJ1IEB8_9SPIO|nr:hypothetical protein [Spirochaetales bacterium]